MNLTLYRKELKGSWKLLVIFAAILTMYISMIISMYDPQMADALKQFEELMPELIRLGRTGGVMPDVIMEHRLIERQSTAFRKD